MTPTEYIDTFQLEHSGYSSYPQQYQPYILLNKSRFTRIVKQGAINQELTEVIRAINEKQDWIIITEPWCGDAAQIVPYLFKMAAINPLINVVVQLRDSNSEIDSYLSNGKMSIPKLIVRNQDGRDLFFWGARPQKLEAKWYNEDKGQSLQLEVLEMLSANQI
jgi:glutaredoxin-related protein